jgi:hypothetical protein
MTQNEIQRSKEAEAFAKAAKGGRQSFLGEYLHFLKSTKKWWMAPLIFLLLLFAALLVLGSTGAAPFIYTLF